MPRLTESLKYMLRHRSCSVRCCFLFRLLSLWVDDRRLLFDPELDSASIVPASPSPLLPLPLLVSPCCPLLPPLLLLPLDLTSLFAYLSVASAAHVFGGGVVVRDH